MTNQTVTLDAKVVDQVIDALDAGYTPGLKDALKVLRAAKADSRTGETTMTTPNIEELIASFPEQNTSNFEWNAAQILNEWGINASAALQSQAERIAEMESLNELAVKQAETLVKQRDTLRSQLDAIAAAEPVAYRWVWKSKPWDIEGWCYTNTPPTVPELQEIEPLFTRPMPAQDVTELVEALEDALRVLAANGNNFGASAQRKARTALAKYKGAK